MAIPVHIINHIIHVAIDRINDSPFSIILSISTLIVAIGTIIGLWKTRESNKLFALEIRAKFSPSFDFRDRKLSPIPDTDYDWEYACTMWNTGNVSVSNISIYHYEYQSLVSINEVIDNEKEIKNILLKKIDSTLEPNHYNAIFFPLKRNQNNDLRIVMWLKYEYLHYKAESIVFLDHYSGEKTGYAWFDNDFILNKRKELKI